MENRKRVKYGNKHVIDVRAFERSDRKGWVTDFSIEEHGADIVETMFYSRQNFPTCADAIKAGVALGCREIKRGYQANA